MESTVEIAGNTYVIGRLSPKRAFHVSRRLAPFLGAILPHFRELFAHGPNGQAPSTDQFAERGFALLPQIADVVARMPDEDADYIVDTCMEVVRVRQERGFAPLMVQGVFMFEDMDMKTMLQLTAEVVKYNLSDFFPSSPPRVPDSLATETTQ